MNKASWKAEFEGKKILIWGFGREGQSSLKWIHTLCPDLPLTIADSGTSKALEEASFNPLVNVINEADTDFSAYDLILKSPGIVIPDGMDRTNLSQQSELFLKHQGFQTVGITGTKGKSTTTSLVYSVLSEVRKTWLVGNIGIPCFDILDRLQDEDLVAFEISCHQLEHCKYSPHTAVFLNLYEEHLDHYGSFKSYGDAKANVFRNQKAGDIAILHKDLPCAEERPDAYLIGRDIYADAQYLYFRDHKTPIPSCRLIGAHNRSNLAIVYAISVLFNVTEAQFAHAIERFEPLHHRLENIGEHHGITYVNDSISTIGETSIAALNALPLTDVILIGGMDRGIDYQKLETELFARKSLHTVFMYASGHRIYDELKGRHMVHENMHVVEDLNQAVTLASRLCRKGHIVLLSPAASSYDHFKNFEERGDVFAKLVNSL